MSKHFYYGLLTITLRASIDITILLLSSLSPLLKLDHKYFVVDIAITDYMHISRLSSIFD